MQLIKGDLLEGDWHFAAHVCNNYTTMGSGVALFLRQKWPQVYEADLEYDTHFNVDEMESKMGTFSFAEIPNGRIVYNLYAMWGIGNNGHPTHRNCSYDSLFNALYEVAAELSPHSLGLPIIIGIPYLMGCCRAGGSWRIVEAILAEIEEHFEEIEFHVYQLEDAEIKAQSTQPV